MGASDNLAVIPADISLLFRCSAAVISLFFDRRFAREMRDFRVLGESVIFLSAKTAKFLGPTGWGDALSRRFAGWFLPDCSPN
jgi:hypothetical protein